MSPPFPVFVELAAPQQTEVAQRYRQTGSGTNEDELIQQYLPLVRTVVGRMAMTLPSHVDKEDLYSAGLIGLLNAVRNYDPSNQTNFETYARIRIRGAVLDELRRMDWVPRSVHAKARKIQSAMEHVQQRKGSAFTDLDIAAELGISSDEYRQWLDEIKPTTFICLDASPTSGGEEGLPTSECIADNTQATPYDDVAQRNLIEVITQRLQELPEMQRKVLALYYLEDLRLREIAEVFGVTESRICQIHSEAIIAIRAHLSKFEAHEI